jgi:hypothetical protein
MGQLRYSSTILDLSMMEVSGQLYAPAALPQEKRSWYPLNRRLKGPQSHSGCCRQEKNLLTKFIFQQHDSAYYRFITKSAKWFIGCMGNPPMAIVAQNRSGQLALWRGFSRQISPTFE